MVHLRPEQKLCLQLQLRTDPRGRRARVSGEKLTGDLNGSHRPNAKAPGGLALQTQQQNPKPRVGDGRAARSVRTAQGQALPGPPRYPAETSACPPLPTGSLHQLRAPSSGSSLLAPRRRAAEQSTDAPGYSAHWSSPTRGSPRPRRPRRPGLARPRPPLARALSPRGGSRSTSPAAAYLPSRAGRTGGRSLRPRPNPTPRAPRRSLQRRAARPAESAHPVRA